MSTDILLKINNVDYTTKIISDGFSVKYIPVYNSSSEFVALDGTEYKSLLGYRGIINIYLEGLNVSEAEELRGIISTKQVDIVYSDPAEITAKANISSCKISPEVKTENDCYWSVVLNLEIPLLASGSL